MEEKPLVASSAHDLSLYFALGWGAAFILVGISFLISGFSFWRLEHGQIRERSRYVKIAGVAMIGRIIAIAQASNLALLELRLAKYPQVSDVLKKVVPDGTCLTITILFGLMTLSLITMIRSEVPKLLSELGTAINAKTNRS